MADLDTRAKRMSGMNHGSPWRSILPDTGASIDQADRQHLDYLYSGILAGGYTPPTDVVFQYMVGPGEGDIYPITAEVG